VARSVVFLSAVRTAFGTQGGTLKDFNAQDLAVPTAVEAMRRAGVRPDQVDQVVYGNVLQSSLDAIYMARHVGLKAGIPQEVPALTVNRLCGSGFEAIASGAGQILLGEAKVCLVGGSEAMSMAPHVMFGLREGSKFGRPPVMKDLLWECLTDTYTGLPMAQTAEKLADLYKLTRVEVDEVAYQSQARWAAADAAGRFDDEIIPFPIKTKKGTVEFRKDEHPRTQTTREILAGLPPFFRKDGFITAGNASGICDGAASLVLADADWAESQGLKPIARLVSWGTSGCDPSIMGIGPAPASRRALAKAGMTLDQMALVEINEAFAPQYLAVEKELGLDRSITNVNGGAIALGHPLGASGARITGTLIHELRRRKERFGLGSACIGGGQGMTVIVEAL
jgi:acetyl-CoA acyltransferase 2